ncbi:ribosomal RNA-processing protein 14 isoform X2 [Brassica rapa]|uniref:Ribosomal RNA-processing protein 14/surfeit locus protein 6 C-terminal domain-containing protein n=2 Tax=Brassica campestris TaxID=3711 RepID=M4CNR1_BRACM|nr:ribosomal RNA-processing protein 14 isoform X2 [Brassica rapa]
MAKKKEKVDSESDVSCVAAHQHAEFFDKLIELIPARFYLPDETEKKWFPGLSKAQKARAKRKTTENLKKARRDRLDPEKSGLTTLDLLKQKIEKEKKLSHVVADDDDDDSEEEETDHKKKRRTDSVTYEELRQRLHRKIDELKGGRGGSDRPRSHEKRKKIVPNKRKRESSSVDESKAEDKGKGKLDVEEAAKDLTYGYVKIDDDEEHGKDKKKRRVSKSRELERALKLEAAKKDPEKGEVIAKKHSWQAATSRAAGIKVHDDPKLLKQSIHKEKKRHEKNAEKWKERVEGQQKVRVEKQQKRSGNIAERIEQNKLRKIAKREKKLLRPGFEGRKEGFVNEGGK